MLVTSVLCWCSCGRIQIGSVTGTGRQQQETTVNIECAVEYASKRSRGCSLYWGAQAGDAGGVDSGVSIQTVNVASATVYAILCAGCLLFNNLFSNLKLLLLRLPASAAVLLSGGRTNIRYAYACNPFSAYYGSTLTSITGYNPVQASRCRTWKCSSCRLQVADSHAKQMHSSPTQSPRKLEFGGFKTLL